MNPIDEEDDGGSSSLFPSLKRRHGPRSPLVPILLAILALVVVGGGGYWYWQHVHGPAGPSGAAAAVPADTSSDSVPTMAAAPATGLPGLSESDSLVRRLSHGISTYSRVTSWLARSDLIRRFVVAVSDVAEGQSPRPRLGFMAPSRAFEVRRADTLTLVDPASYHRYDALTAAFVSLNSQGVAELYQHIRPLCDQAYKELGLPGGTFQDALDRAFGRLLAVQVPAQPPVLVSHGALWAYADPRLEELSPAVKNLLRMGPQNARRIQTKLRELADAMGVTPRAPGA
jgi:hypothetical protein